MLKVYGIDGRTTAVIQIPVGDGSAWLPVEFKRGRTGTQAYNRPATYSTNNVTEQNIIEDSPLFGKTIQLIRVYDDGGSEAEKQDAPVSVLTEYPDVQTKEEAVAFLKAHGAKATDINTNAKLKAYAEKIGVAFPNLSI